MNMAVKSRVASRVLVNTRPSKPTETHSLSLEGPLTKPSSLANAAAPSKPPALRQMQSAVATTHRSMLAALLKAQTTTFDVTATERQRWPVVSAVVESASNTKSINSTTCLQRLQQTRWDSFRNKSPTSHAENLAEIGQINVDLQRRQLILTEETR